MGRLTDNDKQFGPITCARAGWNPLRVVWSSGGGEEDDLGNHLTVYAFGWVARISLPDLFSPFEERHIATSWDAATIERMGRNWYSVKYPREYGFSIHEGFFILFLGAQTNDSATTQSWSTFLPWTQWRFVRRSLYDLAGEHFWTEPKGSAFEEREAMRQSVPKAVFEFDDYDGKRITATTHIEEMEWLFGEGWFKWLSIFRPPKIRRSLDIQFSEEIGKDKGSWKGGTIGHGIDMLPGELHEAAFRRYCAQDHRAKNGKYRITFVKPVN